MEESAATQLASTTEQPLKHLVENLSEPTVSDLFLAQRPTTVCVLPPHWYRITFHTTSVFISSPQWMRQQLAVTILSVASATLRSVNLKQTIKCFLPGLLAFSFFSSSQQVGSARCVWVSYNLWMDVTSDQSPYSALYLWYCLHLLFNVSKSLFSRCINCLSFINTGEIIFMSRFMLTKKIWNECTIYPTQRLALRSDP